MPRWRTDKEHSTTRLEQVTGTNFSVDNVGHCRLLAVDRMKCNADNSKHASVLTTAPARAPGSSVRAIFSTVSDEILKDRWSKSINVFSRSPVKMDAKPKPSSKEEKSPRE